MYDAAYIDYLIYFHCERDYFECHEVLEEHWKQDPPKERKKYWVGFIQIAVCAYHHRRGNFAGALKMISNAIHILENDSLNIKKLGLHSEELIKILKKRKHEILDHKPYYSFNLPIRDNKLMSLCLKRCAEKNLSWGVESDLHDEFLLHKHTKRNRTDVIKERLHQLKIRKNNRSK
ncbi:DUF309 domain-containing protein [Metabacillus sp. YM-086]|uniref:DUF309 domain-containing protein n=1 Tax=Metabacillus sp. YM-086 TaxID=3341729 RepID=UPI003A867A5F